ncbi:MAG TPA: hypothetical protein VNN62_02315, partial [Methylomirabilota bacterium]|nr:hypothetical protein [Methylomirabilota bacterium]
MVTAFLASRAMMCLDGLSVYDRSRPCCCCIARRSRCFFRIGLRSGPRYPSERVTAFYTTREDAREGGALTMQLTALQKRICEQVINVFETGALEGDYGALV